LLNNQGITVIAAFVSPDATVRSRFKELVGHERSLEVFVDTPIEVCRERDNSGLYERADAGEIADFPGVSAPYDHAETFDLRLDASVLSIEESVAAIVEMLGDRGHLRG
jgi:adenylylsulfate kinase-like enzyme